MGLNLLGWILTIDSQEPKNLVGGQTIDFAGAADALGEAIVNSLRRRLNVVHVNLLLSFEFPIHWRLFRFNINRWMAFSTFVFARYIWWCGLPIKCLSISCSLQNGTNLLLNLIIYGRAYICQWHIEMMSRVRSLISCSNIIQSRCLEKMSFVVLFHWCDLYYICVLPYSFL